MTLRKDALKVLAALLPAGVMGMSAALGATHPTETPTPRNDSGNVTIPVSETEIAARLAAIRDAVSTVTGQPSGAEESKGNIVTAWWGNFHGGWGRGFGWRNGGWGWRNGGWPNGWRNGWGNGWPNGWHNGWGNW